MLKQTSILLLLLVVVVAAGCSKRRTRQFIVEDIKTEGFIAGDWLIMNPAVVAFKDVIDMKEIADTTMFWISLRAKRPRDVGTNAPSDLIIDSIKVSFLPDGDEYWRKPTRMAPYGDPGDRFVRKAFDFFGDQGIVIPIGVDSILLEFDALSRTDQGEVVDRSPVSIYMVRDEKRLSVPLLQE